MVFMALQRARCRKKSHPGAGASSVGPGHSGQPVGRGPSRTGTVTDAGPCSRKGKKRLESEAAKLASLYETAKKGVWVQYSAWTPQAGPQAGVRAGPRSGTTLRNCKPPQDRFGSVCFRVAA